MSSTILGNDGTFPALIPGHNGHIKVTVLIKYAAVGQMSQTVCSLLSLFVFGHVLFVLARDAQLTAQTSEALRCTFTPC